MRIPSDIQVNVPASRAGLLEALGLRVGEIFTGEVLGQTPNGLLQLLINGQNVALNLPVEPQIGQVLQFQVKSGGAKPELVLLSTEGRQAPASGTPAPANTQPQQDAVILPQPRAPQPPPGGQQPPLPHNPAAAGTEAASSGAAAEPLPALPDVPPQPSPLPTGLGAPPQAPGAPIVSRPSIPLPPSVQQALNLQPGQTVTAQVTIPSTAGQPQVNINGQTLPAPLPVGLPPGTPVQLQADFSSGAPRLVIVQPAPIQGGQAQPAAVQPQQAAVTPASVQHAVAQATASATVRQDSVGTLLQAIAQIQGRPSALPQDVLDVAQRLLAARVNLDTGTPPAEALRDAVMRSGVFLEAMMARGVPPQSPGGDGDLKSLLLLLRNVLGRFVGTDEHPQPPAGQRPAVPQRGADPRAPLPQPQNPLPNPGDAQDTARHLLSQTDSALSRMRLFQLSSLPDAGARAHHAAPQEWNLELPFVLGGQTAMAQFQITRDGGSERDAALRGWQMIFALTLPYMGPVGARVSFRARRTGVVLWAENEETAAAMEDMLPELVTSLSAHGLEPGAVHVRRGPPAPPPPGDTHVDAVS